MMNYKLSIHRVIIFYVVVVLTLFDMLNGYMVIAKIIPDNGLASPSQIGRLFAILILFFFVIYKRLSARWVYGLVYLTCIEIYGAYLHGNPAGFLFGLVNISKLLYLYLVYLVIIDYLKSDYQSGISYIGLTIKINLVIISFSLIFSTVTGLGNSTYSFGFGTKSFFASGNGLGLYIGVMTLISIYLRREGLYKDIGLITLLLISASISLIGTKAALIFSIVCIINVVAISRYRFMAFTLLILMLLFGGGYYLIDVFNLFFDVVVKRYNNDPSLVKFLGSGRFDYVTNAFNELFSQADAIFRLIYGSGAFLSFQVPKSTVGYDTLETDFFDILFMYGFVGVISLMFVYFYVLFKVKRVLILSIAGVLCFSHSLIAGHVIFNGMSSLCVVILLVLSQTAFERDYD
ncbi:TPA: O-antigen ligase family protein [Aeromonas veronii]|nr:O-antigen ligase family protein [Aeromonas veronii]